MSSSDRTLSIGSGGPCVRRRGATLSATGSAGGRLTFWSDCFETVRGGRGH